MVSTTSTNLSSKTSIDPALLRQRQFLRNIALPIGLAALLVFGAGLFTLFGLRGRDASLVADLTLTCLCLLPALLCLFPIYLALVVSVTVLSRADTFTTRQVRRARTLTADVAERTYQTGDSLSRRSIAFNARFAPLDRLFDVFDRLGNGTASDLIPPEADSKSSTSFNGKTNDNGSQ